MQPIYTKRDEAQRKRLEEEKAWFAAGYEACGTGLELTDWPRPDGLKYSQLWYRIKNAWQDGWKSAGGKAISKYGVEESELIPRSLNDRLFLLIRNEAPITLRRVLRTFSSHDSANVKMILHAFEENDFVKLTGKGTRSSPITIEKL